VRGFDLDIDAIVLAARKDFFEELIVCGWSRTVWGWEGRANQFG